MNIDETEEELEWRFDWEFFNEEKKKLIIFLKFHLFFALALIDFCKYLLPKRKKKEIYEMFLMDY